MKWVKKKPKNGYNERDSVIDKIAKIRGISQIERFLNPTQDELIDPYLLKNIEDVANRIIKAIGNGEKIVVSMDNDTDGVTSGATMVRYLRNYTDNVDFIYGERSTGHGIAEQIEVDSLMQNKEEIDEEKEKRLNHNLSNISKIKNSDLLIIIDSSSNNIETCKKIKSWGTDIIILDHHDIEVNNPFVLMVNPQQRTCEYPNKYLSAVGVVFKVIQVMEDTLGQVDPFQYIDLVAIGMYADVMKMDVLENRFLVMHGLRNIKNAGLVRILKSAKKDLSNLNCSAIGFAISPMINSTARMDNIKLAIDLLLEDDEKQCLKIYKEMKKLNDERKEKQKEVVDNYIPKVDDTKKVIFVIDENASKNFNGLISQQLAETYERPAIVARNHQGTISGSCRSYGDFKMKSFLQQTGFVEAMGHEQAFGVSFKESKLGDLVKYIEENMPELKQREPVVIYDLEIDSQDINEEFINTIQQFNHLTGNGFYRVMVKVNGITVDEVNVIGKNRDTIKITTMDNIEMIRFRTDESYGEELVFFDTIDVLGEISYNEWFNFKTKQKIRIPQIILSDFRVES